MKKTKKTIKSKGSINLTLCSLVAAGMLALATPKVEAQQIKDKPIETCAINIGINGLMGGVGAALNDKNFFEGFATGAIGGTLSTTAKYAVGDRLQYAWPAKLLNAIGSSITYNTARGKKPLESIKMDIGPLMLEYEDGKIYSNFILSSMLRTVYYACKRYNLDLNESFKVGTFVFRSKSIPYDKLDGVTSSNIILLNDNVVDNDVERHELIHTFQNTESQSFAGLFLNSRDVRKYSRFLDTAYLDYSMDTGIMLSTILQTPFSGNNKPVEQEAYRLAH